MLQTVRPYLTTGIALVGAAVIVAAPITVAPPDLSPAQIVACAETITQTASVELAGFTEALITAVIDTVVFYPKLFVDVAPGLVVQAIVNGQFASLVPLAVEIALLGVTGPIQLLAGPFITELPLPLGTADGVVFNTLQILKAVPTMVVALLQAPAAFLDGDLTLAQAIDATIDAVVTGFTTPIVSIQKIVAALLGTLPFAAPAAAPLTKDRSTAGVTSLPAAASETKVVTLDVAPEATPKAKKTTRATNVTVAEPETVAPLSVQSDSPAKAAPVKSGKPASAAAGGDATPAPGKSGKSTGARSAGHAKADASN